MVLYLLNTCGTDKWYYHVFSARDKNEYKKWDTIFLNNYKFVWNYKYNLTLHEAPHLTGRSNTNVPAPPDTNIYIKIQVLLSPVFGMFNKCRFGLNIEMYLLPNDINGNIEQLSVTFNTVGKDWSWSMWLLRNIYIIYIKLQCILTPGECLLRNDHRGPRLNKYDHWNNYWVGSEMFFSKIKICHSSGSRGPKGPWPPPPALWK